MELLIDKLIKDSYLRTPEIIKAFGAIRRKDFLPEEYVTEESVNAPLPIGHGQTNSQPLTVAFMMELLSPQTGQKILDIGSGSCWTTALLAQIVGPTGQVFAIERIAELKEFGEKNVRKFKFSNVEFLCQDGSNGLPNQAPFDRILVSAAAFEIPEFLKTQLKIGGRLVIPTADEDIRLIIRDSEDNYLETIYPGFLFVPLISE
jgi:protein-L-isoaspartate(D-aspartate) O-methyltransferase